jgi:hypothetical protein
MQAADAKAEARFTQAQALWFAGDGSADLTILDAAAQAYHNALNLFSKEKSPLRWITASSMLGQILLRVATLRQEPKMLPSAIEHLRGAVQFADTCKISFDVIKTQTALGRGLLAEYAAGGQPLLLDLAATAFRRAIKQAGIDKELVTKASLQHELGMTQWAMAERAGDQYGLVVASETLEACVAGFNGAGQIARAATAAADLARLKGMLAAPAKSAPVQTPVPAKV